MAKIGQLGLTRIVAIVLVILIGLLVIWFQSYQSRTCRASLTGFWHIGGDYYMMICEDDDRIVFLEFLEDGEYRIIHDENDADITYKSLLATTKHRITLKLSNTSGFSDICALVDFESSNIELMLYPQLGVMVLMKDDQEHMQMVRDNEMTQFALLK